MPGTSLVSASGIANLWIRESDQTQLGANGPLALSAECTGTPPTTAGIFLPGCQMYQTDAPLGQNIFTNVGTTAAPVWSADVTLPGLIVHGTPAAINSTATATAAQVATGYITSTSAAATTITLPTGTLLGTQLSAKQGTALDLFIDNTAGANTVTIAVAVNGILSALAVAASASAGLLTVPAGVTGQACFRLMFSSATAYTFTRIA